MCSERAAAHRLILVRPSHLNLCSPYLHLFRFGWTSLESIPWIVPTLAVGCATMGIFSVYLAVFNYLADCYGPYASSAIAAQSCCRNLVGGAFPIFTEQVCRLQTRVDFSH